MHETHLMKDLMQKIQEIAQHENAKRVIRLKIQLGALSHMTPEHFMEHFEADAKGTVAEGAEVKIEMLEDIHDPKAQGIILESLEIAE